MNPTLVDEQVKGEPTPQTEFGEELAPIDLDLVPVNIKLTFPIFRQVGRGPERKLILVTNQGAGLSKRIREQLRRDGLAVYTKEKHLKTYAMSVENNFEEILTDESVDLEKRASILYEKGENVIEAFFKRPESTENYKKTQELVGNIVLLAHSNEQGALSMMNLAQRDYNTYSHSLHVCILGVGFSQSVLADKRILEAKPILDDLHELGEGFIYHDLAKSLVDASILKKAGPLSPLEWEAIKKHPADGAQMIQEMGIRKRDVLHITLYHHERMDGTGYPYGLTGDTLPVISRIAAITDGFDAITSRRPYKEAMTTFQALSIMKEENVGFYDPELFEKFVMMFRSQPKDSVQIKQSEDPAQSNG